MKLTDRMRAAMSAFRIGSQNQIVRIDRSGKAMPYVWPEYRMDQPAWKAIDEQAYFTEGYDVNALVYSAVMYKALALASVPVKAYIGETEKPERLPDDHPLANLCMRPNPSMSWREYMMVQTIYLNLTGNAYTYYDRQGAERGCPSAMWPLNPLRTYIVPSRDKKKIIGFVYVPEGKGMSDGTPMLAEDVGHVKFPNPADPLDGMGYGMPPLIPAGQSVDVDNLVTKFLAVFFRKGAIIAGLLKFNVPLNSKIINEIRERWLEIYGGAENWYKPGVLDQGGEYQRIGLTFDEMGFSTLDERNESRILSAIRVPPILIGSRLGLMRCLPATAMLSTIGGPVRIVDIQPGTIVWSFENGKLCLRQVKRLQETGIKDIYLVRTKNRTLRASGNHPVMVRICGNSKTSNLYRNASCAWKTIDDLQTGDYIVQPKSYPDSGGLDLPDGSPASREFIQFCGALIGDGTVYGNGMVLMAMPPQGRCRDHYQSLVEQLFSRMENRVEKVTTKCLHCGKDIHTRRIRVEDGRGRYCSKECKYESSYKLSYLPVIEVDTLLPVSRSVHITDCPRSFNFRVSENAEYLRALGLGERAHTKRIPHWIYGLSRELRLNFLAGLVDTDGSIDKRGVLKFAFCNELLTYDVRELLISAGIQCSNIRHDQLSPSVLPQRGIKEIYHNYSFVASSARQVAQIPFADTLYRERVNANLGRYKPDSFDAKKADLSDDLGFYKVVSIEKQSVETVYDIEVEGGHSFIADGILVHNSTYANYQEARKAFWEDVALGEASLFETDHQYYMQSDDGGWVKNDYSDIPALRQDTPALVTAFTSLVGYGVSKYQAAVITGLEVGQLPDGDMIYMPMNLIPVGKVGEEEIETGIPGETVTTEKPAPTPEEGNIPEAGQEAEQAGTTGKAIMALANELKRATDLLLEAKDAGSPK